MIDAPETGGEPRRDSEAIAPAQLSAARISGQRLYRR
jgi:hypothetical protein